MKSFCNKKAMLLLTTFATISILLPLIALAFKTPYFQPFDPKNISLTKFLKNSNGLWVTHISCLASLVAVMIDIFLDCIAQNKTISHAVRLKERFTILLGMVLPSSVYFTCRAYDNIAHYYVAANYTKTMTLVAALYCAMYPELNSKDDNILYCGFMIPFALWIVGIILAVYSFYFDSQAMSMLSAVVPCICYVIGLGFSIRWFQLVKVRQNVGRFVFKLLNLEEFTFLLFWTALLVYAPLSALWNLITGDLNWKTHTAENLIFLMCTQVIFGAVLIVVPGRIVRMMIEVNLNMLGLKQKFVRHVSHEIRSPLNIVHAGLDIVRSEIQMSADPTFVGGALTTSVIYITAETAAMIEQAFAASGTAIEILDDLLIYEHIDSGALKLELAWHPSSRFLEKNFAWAEILSEKNNIKLTITNAGRMSSRRNLDIEEGGGVSIAEQDAYLHVDMFKIDQVIRNLVSNAVKFSPVNGTIDLKLIWEFLTLSNTNSIVSKVGVDAIGVFRVEVVDSGVGIDPAFRVKVFGEFNQFNRNELQGGGGSGLGLWISRRIIHMHNGKMGLFSAGPNQGSTFFFELPLHSAASTGEVNPTGMASSNPVPSHPIPASSNNRVAARSIRMNTATHHPVLPASKVRTSASKDCNYIVSHGTADIDIESNACAVGQHLILESTIGAIPRAYSMAEGSDDADIFTTATAEKRELDLEVEDGDDIESDNLLVRKPIALKSNGHHLSPLNPRRVMKVHPEGGASDPPVIESIRPGSKIRFLIVDDSAMNRKVVARIIDSEKDGGRFRTGFSATRPEVDLLEADDGVSAVEMLRAEMAAGRRVDMVLMDFVMLKMHGPEAAAIMRNTLHYSGPIAGNALPDDISLFIANGANELVTKPLTKSKLMDAVGRNMTPLLPLLE